MVIRRFSCTFFALIFFISFSIPHYDLAFSSSSSTDQKNLSSKSSDGVELSGIGYEDLLVFRVQFLTPTILAMSQALEKLHNEYANYFEFWHLLLAHVPEADQRGPEVHEILQKTETIFTALDVYSKAYQSEIVKTEEQIRKSTDSNLQTLAFQQASTDTLLGILERLCQYEIHSQDLLADLYHKGIEALSDYVAPSAFQKLDDFEKLRKAQLTKYFESRQNYEDSIRTLSALESHYNNDARELLQHKAKDYFNFSVDLSDTNKMPGKHLVKLSGDHISILLAQKIKQLAERKARDFLALDATFSEGDDGQVWPILFSPFPNENAMTPADGLDQVSMARDLIGTLDAMRPSLRSLVDILIKRNEAFFQDSFIENDRLNLLRESLALETIRLVRFRTIDKEINAANISSDKIINSERIATLYAEIGYLKEDILANESAILREILFLNENDFLNSHSMWPLILGLIQKQREWNDSWLPQILNWEQSVKVFRQYQLSVLKRYTAALQTISGGIKGISQELQAKESSKATEFIKFVDREILQRLAETQGMLLKKQELVSREENDPIFASLFGVSSDRFWHDFWGQGSAFWQLEKLIRSKEEILSKFLALSEKDENEPRWALEMIEIADALDLVHDVGIIEEKISVVFGTGPEALVLKGLLELGPPVLKATSLYSQSRLYGPHILKMLAAVFFPRQAHAGFLSGVKNWAGAVAGQMKKNAANYAVIGAIAVGSLAAGPAAPVVAAAALAAFKAQATADAAIATARTAGDALVSDPNVRKTMHERINKLETAYNISKIVEGGANLWKGYSGQKEITKGAVKFSDRISGYLRGMKARQGELIRKATKIREFLNRTTRSAATIEKATQILDDIATEANGIRILMEEGGRTLAGTVNKFIAAAEAGAKANEAGGILATLYGLLPGGDGKKPDSPTGSSSTSPTNGSTAKDKTNDPKDKPEIDSDGDGTPDSKDGCAADPKKTFPGECGCGKAETDKDSDGTPDCNDNCPDDADKTEPGDCDCGTPDADQDGDGTPDCNDECPKDGNKIEAGKCGCHKTDTDEDGDGTLDCNDICPRDPEKTEPGECGCGTPDDDSNINGVADCKETKDSDGDTIPDINDKCPRDPEKTEPGECGCGIADDDSNINGVADCKESKKSGCSSDGECTQGYVCDSQSGQCVSPFDQNYTSRNQLMAGNEQERQRENTEQNIADANLDPNEGKFTSKQTEKEINRTQETMRAECGPQKPCPNPDKSDCVEGKCIKRKDDEKQECKSSSECPDGKECENGKCITKSGCKSDGECPEGKKCQNGKCVKKTECNKNGDCSNGQKCQNGKCIKTGCTNDKDCKKGYRCKNGKCIKQGCEKDRDCKKGYRCKNGKCVKKGCSRDSECKSGYRCKNGSCVKKASKPPTSSGTCSMGPDNNRDGICDICGKRYKR